jgi:hypothetical protein
VKLPPAASASRWSAVDDAILLAVASECSSDAGKRQLSGCSARSCRPASFAGRQPRPALLMVQSLTYGTTTARERWCRRTAPSSSFSSRASALWQTSCWAQVGGGGGNGVVVVVVVVGCWGAHQGTRQGREAGGQPTSGQP